MRIKFKIDRKAIFSILSAVLEEDNTTGNALLKQLVLADLYSRILPKMHYVGTVDIKISLKYSEAIALMLHCSEHRENAYLIYIGLELQKLLNQKKIQAPL